MMIPYFFITKNDMYYNFHLLFLNFTIFTGHLILFLFEMDLILYEKNSQLGQLLFSFLILIIFHHALFKVSSF